MPASTQRINELVGSIASQLASVDMLKETATRSGQGVKASCISEKESQLQAALTTARNLQSQWAGAEHNAAYGARIMDRVNTLELSANAYAADAKACTDASNLGFKLEVIVPPSLPDEPRGWSIATPAVFERPPLASPY